LIHDNGYLESGLMGSLELLVAVDETVSMVKRIMRGIPVNEETLAVDVAEKVGIGGNFLQEEHTLRHFKDEIWSPKIMDRQTYQGWETTGSKTMKDRCTEKVHEILKSHEPDPPLDEKLVRELGKFIEKIEKE
jgi:trimethylamine--corrinoid protein Co-methyltransferase